MDLNRALSVVEARAALAEVNREWLSIGFLTDENFTPQEYIERARWQASLVRELNAVADAMAVEATLQAVA
jgi:hypothetical protein